MDFIFDSIGSAIVDDLNFEDLRHIIPATFISIVCVMWYTR
jgi:hypothetical protein